MLARQLAEAREDQRKLSAELDVRTGRSSGAPRLKVTRPTPYARGDDEWYEIEVLVSNVGQDTAHSVSVTPFVGGLPVGEATPPVAIPPGRGVAFCPRIPRPVVLRGPLSIRAGNSETEAWWRPAH